MKLVVIGFGQCGCRIVDEFARLNVRARQTRGIEIITGAFAVNTDTTDLSGLKTISPDYQHRILIGGRKTGGHGVGKINELSAQLAREDADKIVDAIRTARRFYETDAFLLIGSSGGGTGSGCLPIITQEIKERYLDKPVYTMIILPFRHEETTEVRTVYNSATCLKSVRTVADAVFLIDNQRFIRKEFSLGHNIDKINSLIVEPFFNLLCAGEETKRRHVGAKTMDAGDILQTFVGWTVIGYGSAPLARRGFAFGQGSDFIKNSTVSHNGLHAMDAAISELSLKCDPKNSGRALYVVSGPHGQINMELVKELGDHLRDLAPEAIIRSGDYPRQQGTMDVTLVLSELYEVEKVKGYYNHAIEFMQNMEKRQEEVVSRTRELETLEEFIPSLFPDGGDYY